MNSGGRDRSIKFMRGGRICQPGLACGNGGKSFPEHCFPLPPTGILGLGAAHPDTGAPHGVNRAGFS